MQSIDKNGRATVGLARDAHEAWTGDGDRRGFIVPRTLWALRSQVCFAAAVAHARLRLSRLELIVAFPAEPPAATRQQRVPSFRATAFVQARGGALWEREPGGGRVGFAGARPLLGVVRAGWHAGSWRGSPVCVSAPPTDTLYTARREDIGYRVPVRYCTGIEPVPVYW